MLAVFRRSVYCRAPSGALVCIGPVSLGAGPLNVLAALPAGLNWEEHGVSPGSAAECDGTTLRFNGRLGISLANAGVWRPATPPADWDPRVLSAGLATLEADRWAPADGLASAIPALVAGRPIAPDAPGPTQALMQAAAPGIAALRTWLGTSLRPEAGHAAPTLAVEGLLGLGPGLTPSGDDLLGGAMIALRALGWPLGADTLARWLLLRARSRTHAISYAHLSCAARGQGAGAVHDTLVALCTRGTPRLRDHLRAVGALGHSSGWDALTGVVLAAEVAAASRSAARLLPNRTGLRPSSLARV